MSKKKKKEEEEEEEKPKKKAKKKVSLEELYKSFDTEYGEGSIVDAGKVNTKFIPTGILPLDLLIPSGGFPTGKLIMVKAPEGAGKTTLLLSLLAHWQKLDVFEDKDISIFVDAEFRFDEGYAAKCNVDVSEGKVKLLHGLWAEANLEMAEKLMRTGKVRVLIVDSIPALVPKREVEDEMDDEHVGLLARKLSQALRKLIPVAYKTDTTMIVTNQIRDNIGNTWGSNETIPGGRMLKHCTSLTLDIRKIKTLTRKLKIRGKEKKLVIGQICKLKAVKGLGAEGREAEIFIYYGLGVNEPANIFNIAEDYGIIKKKKETYFYNKKKLGAGGRLQVIRKFMTSPDLQEEVKKEIIELFEKYNL